MILSYYCTVPCSSIIMLPGMSNEFVAVSLFLDVHIPVCLACAFGDAMYPEASSSSRLHWFSRVRICLLSKCTSRLRCAVYCTPLINTSLCCRRRPIVSDAASLCPCPFFAPRVSCRVLPLRSCVLLSLVRAPQVTIDQVIGGARGIKSMIWETSNLDADEVCVCVYIRGGGGYEEYARYAGEIARAREAATNCHTV